MKIRFPARDSAKDKNEKSKGDSKSQRMAWSHTVSLAEDNLQTAVTTLRDCVCKPYGTVSAVALSNQAATRNVLVSSAVG